MRKGYSLLELQAALFLGVITAVMSAKVIWFEYERLTRLDAHAVIRMELNALDSSIQWALAGANQIQLNGNTLVFESMDADWKLAGSGLSRDGAPAIHLRSKVRLETVKLDKQILSCTATLSYRGQEASAPFRYLLNDGLVTP